MGLLKVYYLACKCNHKRYEKFIGYFPPQKVIYFFLRKERFTSKMPILSHETLKQNNNNNNNKTQRKQKQKQKQTNMQLYMRG